MVQNIALVSAFILTCGGKVDDFVLSVMTEKRRKSEMLGEMAADVKNNYDLPENVVIRWDEKKVERNGVTKERCAVVLDGDERPSMHIGSPVLDVGDAKTKSEEVIKLCSEWGVKKEKPETIPVCIGFDTTSTNTGYKVTKKLKSFSMLPMRSLVLAIH